MTTLPTAETIAELRKLHDEATRAPWQSLRDGNQYVETTYMPTAKCVGASRVSGPVRPWNPHALLAFGFKPKEYETVRFIDADADLVAQLRNNADALLAAAARALGLEAFLREYGAVTGKALLAQRDIRLGNGHTGAAVAYDAALHEFTALLERLDK